MLDIELALLVLGVMLLLVVSAFFSASETALTAARGPGSPRSNRRATAGPSA